MGGKRRLGRYFSLSAQSEVEGETGQTSRGNRRIDTPLDEVFCLSERGEAASTSIAGIDLVQRVLRETSME